MCTMHMIRFELVPTSRTVQPLELNGIYFVRWEDDMLDEVCVVLLNEWMKEI